MLNYGKSDLVRVRPNLRRRGFRAGRPPLLQEGRRGKHQPCAALHPQGAEARRVQGTQILRRRPEEPARNGQPRQGRGHRGQGNGRDHPLLRQHRPQDERNHGHPGKQGAHTGAHRQDGNHQAGAGHAACRTARTRQTHRAQRRQKVRHHPASERGAARRGVRAGNRQVAPYRTDTGNQRRHIETGAGRGKYSQTRRRSNAATRGRTRTAASAPSANGAA